MLFVKQADSLLMVMVWKQAFFSLSENLENGWKLRKKKAGKNNR